MSRVSLSATAFTYGQWLQMNITTVPFFPRTDSSEWRLPSVPRRSNGGAVVPRFPVAVVAMASLRERTVPKS